MRERSRGSIIISLRWTSELAARPSCHTQPPRAACASSPRGLATELGPICIRGERYRAGLLITEMNRPLIDNAEFDGGVRNRTPSGAGQARRARRDRGIPRVRASSYMTARSIFVDGGMSISI